MKDGDLFTAYGAIHIFNLVSCLTAITYATIASIWLGVHRDEEINYFIMEYYSFAIAVPATFMSFAIVGVIVAELIRVWIIYTQPAFWVGIGTCASIVVPCCWFATKIVFTTIDLLARWAFPALLVARTTLGTINHSLLTIEALRRRDIPLIGVAFVGEENAESQAAIAHMGKVRRLGRLPSLKPLTRAALRAAFAASFAPGDFV